MPPLSSLLVLSLTSLISVAHGQVDCSKPPEGWPRRPPQCCDLPFPVEDMKRSFAGCIRQIGRPTSAVPTPKSVRDTRLCLEECVYKGVGFMRDGQNELQKETIEQKLQEVVAGSPSWSEGVKKAMEVCFGEGKPEEGGSEESSCSPAPHQLTHCLLRNLFLNCPSDIWNSSEECEVVKKRMEECPEVPPPPPPPPQGARFQQQPPPRPF